MGGDFNPMFVHRPGEDGHSSLVFVWIITVPVC